MASLALDLDTNKAKCDNPERLAQGKKKKKCKTRSHASACLRESLCGMAYYEVTSLMDFQIFHLESRSYL